MGRIEYVLETCCAIKAQVVLADERDTGLRMILNFGHTLGHAYELAYHYETWTHGQAVAAGMCRRGGRLGVTPGRHPGGDSRAHAAGAVPLYGLPDRHRLHAADYADRRGSGQEGRRGSDHS